MSHASFLESNNSSMQTRIHSMAGKLSMQTTITGPRQQTSSQACAPPFGKSVQKRGGCARHTVKTLHTSHAGTQGVCKLQNRTHGMLVSPSLLILVLGWGSSQEIRCHGHHPLPETTLICNNAIRPLACFLNAASKNRRT